MAFHKIVLSHAEILQGIAVANRRRDMNVKNGRGKSHIVEKSDLIGCWGEIGFAKFSGLAWDGEFFEEDAWQYWRKNGHDVGKFEVRSTDHPFGRLWCYEKDSPENLFVFARIELPFVFIHGWAFGREVQAQELDPGKYDRPCHYLPMNKLKSFT